MRDCAWNFLQFLCRGLDIQDNQINSMAADILTSCYDIGYEDGMDPFFLAENLNHLRWVGFENR